MNAANDQNLIRAFADGELTAAQQAEFVQRLAEEPGLLRQVLAEQRMRAACHKAIMRDMPDAPQALREQIAALQVDDGSEQPSQPAEPAQPDEALQISQGEPAPTDKRGSIAGRIGAWRWVPLAAAAVVLLAAIVTFQAANDATPGGTAPLGIVQVGLDDRQAELFAKRHSICARDPSSLTPDPSLPDSVDRLRDAVATRFNAPCTGLDLSGIGYRFLRVGPCSVPGHKAVHLLYEPMNQTDDRPQRISLWVMPTPQESELTPGRVYRLSLPESDLPLVLWSKGGLNYYLVADTHFDAEAATKALQNDQPHAAS